jgi:hypothetical protein
VGKGDREWVLIERKLEANRRLATTAEESVRELMESNDETFMTSEQLQEVIQRKQLSLEQRRVTVLEQQDKLLWELALALKRALVQENGPMTMKGVGISQIAIQSILEKAEAEDPRPETWDTWIGDIYRHEQI